MDYNEEREQPLYNRNETIPLVDSPRRKMKSPYLNPKLFLTIFVPLVLGFGAGILVWGLTFPPSIVHLPGSPCLHPHYSSKVTKLIFLIGDGFGPSAVTLTREMLNRSLSFDGFMIGSVKTYSSDSLVTDSAAAATAMACGIKTYNDGIAVNDKGVAIGTIMEAAKAAGLSAGIVATSPVSHATPASFSSHAINRDLMDFIAFQQVQQQIDIILGGGLSNFQANNSLALKKASELGYKIIYNQTALEKVSLPVLGLFAPYDMTYMIDKEPNSTEPSLSEMVNRSLHLLTEQANQKGFILLIEGSRIDHAEHENDPVATYREAIEFEKTYQLVIDYAKSKGDDTLVLATADHETGGLSLGRDGIYNWNPDVLKSVTKSARFITNAIKSSPNESAIFIFESYTSLNLTQAEKDQIYSAWNGDLLSAVSGIISKRSLTGWTTGGHSGVDVNLYGWGPSVHLFCGNNDNTDLAKKILKIFPWDIEAITNKLKNFDTSGKNYTSAYESMYQGVTP